jgi:CHASE2 domain-containing sensor protein
MTVDQLTLVSVCLGLLAIAGMVAVLAAGVVCLIRYGKTRKSVFLIVGLLLTLLLPGCIILLAILVILPQAFVVYGPPSSNYIP